MPSISPCLGTGGKQALNSVEDVGCSPCSSLAEQYLLMGAPDGSSAEWQGISLPWELSEHESATHDFQCSSLIPDQQYLSEDHKAPSHHQPQESAVPPICHDQKGAESEVMPSVSNADRRLLPPAHPLPVLNPCRALAGPDDMSLAGTVALCESEATEEAQRLQASALALMLHEQGQQQVGSNLGAQAGLQMSLIDRIPQALQILAGSQHPAHAPNSPDDWILDDISANMRTKSQEQYLDAPVLPPLPPAASGPVTEPRVYSHAPTIINGTQPPEQGSASWRQGLQVCLNISNPSMTMPNGHTHLELEQLSLPQLSPPQSNLGENLPGFSSPKIAPSLLQWSPSCLLRLSLGGDSAFFPLYNARSAVAGQSNHDSALPGREAAIELASNKQVTGQTTKPSI